jgi:S-adenosylmethionine hydrolase
MLKPSGIVTLLTDFGSEDAFVGIMKGVMLGINPHVRLVDLTHAVPPQQIRAGALALRSAVSFFPSGTVHLTVVDPGVGSERLPIAIETASAWLVGPDNGVLSLAAALLQPRSVRRIENHALFLRPLSQTFHGRDLFAPVAAHLSRGLAPAALGSEISGFTKLYLPAAVRTPLGVLGEVLYVDHFGNLITNIEARLLESFRGRRLSVSIGITPVAGPVTAYSAVAEGALLAIFGSWGMMEIAVRNGSAADLLGAGPATPVMVTCEFPEEEESH